MSLLEKPSIAVIANGASNSANVPISADPITTSEAGYYKECGNSRSLPLSEVTCIRCRIKGIATAFYRKKAEKKPRDDVTEKPLIAVIANGASNSANVPVVLTPITTSETRYYSIVRQSPSRYHCATLLAFAAASRGSPQLFSTKRREKSLAMTATRGLTSFI